MLVAVLVNPKMPREFDFRNVEDVARSFGLRLMIVNASDAAEFDAVFASLARGRVGALIIIADTYFTSNSEKMKNLAYLSFATRSLQCIRPESLSRLAVS